MVVQCMARNRRWKFKLVLVGLLGVGAFVVRNRFRGRSESATGVEAETTEPRVTPAEPPAPDWAYDVINPLIERLLGSHIQ